MDHIADIRTDYRMAALDEDTAGPDPVAFFLRWFAEAEAARIEEVNAMTLATVDALGHPHARIVLLKGLEQGGFTFYTNYESAKGKEMQAHDQVALVFFWKELERQVRVEGTVVKVPGGESDVYFHSRPRGSQIGAWTSPQSQVLADRSVLETRMKDFTKQFESGDVPRPGHWGGYRVMPQKIEFWQGRASRLHDRIVFERQGDQWKKYRVAP